MVKIAFVIDDVNPKDGYNLKDKKMDMIKELHDRYGTKFTLFVPAMFEGGYDLRNNKEWCDYIKGYDWIDVNVHGLTHQCIDPKQGAQEFLGISNHEIDSRIKEMKKIMTECFGAKEMIFKAPGWYIRPEHFVLLQNNGYKSVADNFIGQRGLQMMSRMVRYPYTLSIENLHSSHYTDTIILHSHIEFAGSNKNAIDRCYNDVVKYLDGFKEINGIFLKDVQVKI